MSAKVGSSSVTPTPASAVLGASGPAQQPPNISVLQKKDAAGKFIPNTVDGAMVRIRLFDDRERVLFFKDTPSPTAAQVCALIGTKLDISAAAMPFFALWIVGTDLELQIRPKVEVREIADKWPRYLSKYTHHTITGKNSATTTSFKFVFKREAMVLKSQEATLKDEIAVKLLYGEARNNIMSGRYPMRSVDEAVTMASLQAQVIYGDIDTRKHGPGSQFVEQSLDVLVPRYMTASLKPAEWELQITAAWAALKASSSQEPAYRKCLALARKWDYYGATFFPACKTVPQSGYFELRTEHLWIAVNGEGISVVDDDVHKATVYAAYEGLEWECTPDSVTLDYTTPTGTSAMITFITPQAHLVDSLASRAIYNIERAARRAVRAKQILAAPAVAINGIKASPSTGIKASPSTGIKASPSMPGGIKASASMANDEQRRPAREEPRSVREEPTSTPHAGTDPSDYMRALNEYKAARQ